MADIPDRDDLERQLARILAKVLRLRRGEILEALGDPPDINKMTPELWDRLGDELARELSPFIERTFVAAAGRLIAATPLGVDWAVVNQRAAEWARRYTFDLVRGITQTDMNVLRLSVSAYYEQGQTMGQLIERLEQIFSPVRAEMVAVTEVTRAASEGEQEIARELAAEGINMIPVWQTNDDELVCPVCGPRDGQEITDGVYPPLHPRCRCWTNHELPKVRRG